MSCISIIAPALFVLIATVAVQAQPDPDAVWQPRERRQACNALALYPLLSHLDSACSTAFTQAAFGAALPAPAETCRCVLQIPNTPANIALTDCEVSGQNLRTVTESCRVATPQTTARPPTPPPTPRQTNPSVSPATPPPPPPPPPPTNRGCTLVQLASGAAQLNNTCRMSALAALGPNPPPQPSQEEFCGCFSQPTRAYMVANLDCTAPDVAPPEFPDRTMLSAWDQCAEDFPEINYCNRMEDSCPLYLGPADTCYPRVDALPASQKMCLAAAMCDPAAHAACTGGSATQCSALAACNDGNPAVTGISVTGISGTAACLAAVSLTGVPGAIAACQPQAGSFETSTVCQAAVMTALEAGCTPTAAAPTTAPPTTPAPIAAISDSVETTVFSVSVRFNGDLATVSAANQELIKTRVRGAVYSRKPHPKNFMLAQIMVTLSSGSIVATATFPAGTITQAEAAELASLIEDRPITIDIDGRSVPSVGASFEQTGGGDAAGAAGGGDDDDSNLGIIVGAAVGGVVVVGVLIFLATRSDGGGGGGSGGQEMTDPANPDKFGFEIPKNIHLEDNRKTTGF